MQARDSYPRALASDETGRKAIDWIIAALKPTVEDDITIVGGYHIEKLVKAYPGAAYYYNADWAASGSVKSLALLKDDFSGPCIVSETDIIYHDTVIRNLLSHDGDIVALRSVEDGAPYIGLVKFTAAGTERAKAFLQNVAAGDQVGAMSIAEFMVALERAEPGSITPLSIDHGWARVDARLSMARFVMGSKSQTLERLHRRISSAIVLDQVRFTVADWQASAGEVRKQISSVLGRGPVIVRSSALSEDSWNASAAGQYQSVLNVDAGNADELGRAINDVIGSFTSLEGGSVDGAHEVFVQPFLSKVRASGVIFTRDLETSSPYCVVSYDDDSGDTDTVTAGKMASTKTAYVLQGHMDRLPETLTPLGPMIEEITGILDHDALDLEFAIGNDGQCYLLQVRPIAVAPMLSDDFDERDLFDEVESASIGLSEMIEPHPYLYGRDTVLANMTDWNPAEIIGTTPRPLAASLYETLVTKDIWARSRRDLGYKDVVGVPLMTRVIGRPYIDVRASLNSLLPASIDGALAEKIVNANLNRLRRYPQLQDKVEFEIACTCLDLDFGRTAERLGEDGLEADEIASVRSALTELTSRLLTSPHVDMAVQRVIVGRLQERRQRILDANASSVGDLCRDISLLISDCRDLGTLPFANVARAAFVASAILKSLERKNIFSAEEIDDLYRVLPTVAHDLVNAMDGLSAGRLQMTAFLNDYGHLRPGTYNILSPSYRDAPELYFCGAAKKPPQASHGAPRPFDDIVMSKREAVAELLAAEGLDIEVDHLFRFICDVIPGREWLKFEFTKSLSAAISMISRLGAQLDFSDDDLSFLPIDVILDIAQRVRPHHWRDDLRRRIESNRKYYAVTERVRLPSMIASPQDVLAYVDQDEWPNFITAKAVRAPVVVLSDETDRAALAGKIVAIESADPGYDWLFGYDIAGLVTKYGGVASHMAIRCAEFGLPAAIGCGERIFGEFQDGRVIELDCAGKRMGRLE